MERRERLQLNGKDLIAGSLALALLLTLFMGSDGRVPISSAETQFVEQSSSGLQIVPASCESTPPYEHSAGECAGPPPSGRSCSLTLTPSTIASGQTATLGWSIGTDTWSTVQSRTLHPNVGTISGNSGSLTVSPTQTTTYTLSVHYAIQFLGFSLNEETITCNASLTIDGGSTQCPTGQTWNGTQCVDAGDDGDSCPLGYTGAGCATFTGCPSTHTLIAGVCVPNANQCGGFICVGNDQYTLVGTYPQCVPGTLIQACAYACSGGGCVLPPPGSGNITATPSLLRSGETTTIAWTTNDMEPGTCSISENNPVINDNRASVPNAGTFTSSEIRQQTNYVLSCTGIDGEPFSDNVTVNILPLFEEQ